MSTEQVSPFISDQDSRVLETADQYTEVDQWAVFFADEFGSEALVPVLVSASAASEDLIGELVAQGVNPAAVEVVENLEIFATLDEVRQDVLKKTHNNQPLLQSLGSIARVFGGCGGLFHLHAHGGLPGTSPNLLSAGKLERPRNGAFDRLPKAAQDLASHAWQMSGGDLSKYAGFLQNFLPRLRLILDQVVGVDYLLSFGAAK